MDAEIKEKVDQLRREGWCVLERIIPEDAIDRVRAHVQEAHEKARQDYEAMGGHIGRQTGPNGEPGVCLIAYLSEFAPYLGDERLLGVAQAVFGGHVRIAQTEFKTQVPNREDLDWRGFHSDWPHDSDRQGFRWSSGAVLSKCDHAAIGAVDAVAVWARDGRDVGGAAQSPRPAQSANAPDAPKGWRERIDQFKPIRGEIQVVGPEGSALVMDSRIWHSTAANPSPEPRVAIITRYCPWWLSVEFGGRNNAIVPRETYEALPEAVKPLYRHRAEGEVDAFRGEGVFPALAPDSEFLKNRTCSKHL